MTEKLVLVRRSDYFQNGLSTRENLTALRAAIDAAKPTPEWNPEHVPIYFDLVQGTLQRWVDDIERTAARVEAAIDRATRRTECGRRRSP